MPYSLELRSPSPDPVFSIVYKGEIAYERMVMTARTLCTRRVQARPTSIDETLERDVKSAAKFFRRTGSRTRANDPDGKS